MEINIQVLQNLGMDPLGQILQTSLVRVTLTVQQEQIMKTLYFLEVVQLEIQMIIDIGMGVVGQNLVI